MRTTWFSRIFFAVVGAVALAGVLAGTACTKWGQPGPVPPSLAPLSSIYVNPAIGSDTSGNGSLMKPYKSLTKAIEVLASAKSVAQSGVTIFLTTGDYNRANGEIFPIVVPTNVTIDGSGYGGGPGSGTFIDGLGEDLLFERAVHAPPKSAYTTLEVAAGATVSLSGTYVGASKINLPGSKSEYVALDTLGTLNATDDTFGAALRSSDPNVSGMLVAGGTLECISCQVHGNYFGIGGLSVPVATASPYAVAPSITLSTQSGDSTIAAKVADLLTDGTVNVTASGEHFERGLYSFADSLHPVVLTTFRGALDFGGGAAQSPGGNIFIGARVSEISIVRRFESVSALDDTWNPGQQQANRNGNYTHKIVFGPGTTGKNVQILHDAAGSTVTVGPAPPPTPTPSPTSSASPSPTPT